MISSGKLNKLSEMSEISVSLLCDYVARRKYPSRKRAECLETVCKKLKINISKEQWIFEKTEILKKEINKLEI